MAQIYYQINAGYPNFTAHIEPNAAPDQTHSSTGIYSFDDIPTGNYSITITDAIGCEAFFDNINITTTTTTSTTMSQCCPEYYYNGYSILGIENSSIANTDWRVPSRGDWTQLYSGNQSPFVFTYLNMGKYKSINNMCFEWNPPNTGALNIFGVDILPVGYRASYNGLFEGIGDWCGYSYADNPIDEIDFRTFMEDATSGTNADLRWGNPVRLVRDAVGIPDGALTTYVGNNGRMYQAVAINGLYILNENLKETLHRDGSVILKINNSGDWMTANTSAYCILNDELDLCY